MPCFTLWKHVHWKPRTLSPAAADLVLVRSMRIFSRGEAEFSCSFCGKSPDQVEKLIAGEDVYICDSCTNVCKSLLDKELGVATAPVDDIEQRLQLVRGLLELREIAPEEFDK